MKTKWETKKATDSLNSKKILKATKTSNLNVDVRQEEQQLQKRRDEYYAWILKQAKCWFVLTAGLYVAGFALIVAAVVMALLKIDFQLSILSVVGGVITEFLANTVSKSYDRSQTQVKDFSSYLREDVREEQSFSYIRSEKQDDIQREHTGEKSEIGQS